MNSKTLFLGIVFFLVATFTFGQAHRQTSDHHYKRALSEVLNNIQERFGVTLKYDVDTVGKSLFWADFRIRPYSVEESLTNVLAPFDYKFVKQSEKVYKIKSYEYPRRTVEDGVKMTAWLNSLYHDASSWESRKECLRKEVREKLDIDAALKQTVNANPILSKVRKFDGYTVQNIALETLPGLFVCGSIYTPAKKGKHPLIICPNGHFGDGRYRTDQQQRMGTLARMGAVCIDYDLFGWGESEWQVGSVGHRSAISHIIQAMNGLLLLDYMLTRKDIDPTRIGVNGGSGGGSQAVLLTALDDRFTAAAPVVSLASHFDGGCPCESGMPVSLACGGTNNAELMAMFAPRPLLIVSDGKDWTSSVPELEYPYLQRIYGFYDAQDKVKNVHLPTEGHDFGPNKRNAVYHFFATTFGLDSGKIDESKVTIEPHVALMTFGERGELLPEHAIRKFDDAAAFFGNKVTSHMKSDAALERKAKGWVESLQLNDLKKESYASTLIFNHLKTVRDWHNNHPFAAVPEKDPVTGEKRTQLEREMIADAAMPREVHTKLMKGLHKVLTEEQVEAILDKYTVGKVDFTMRGYKAIVPDLTAREEAYILARLKEAREEAIDYKNMKQISAVFEKYKTQCEQYLNDNGRNWRQLYKDYTDKRKAEKENNQK